MCFNSLIASVQVFFGGSGCGGFGCDIAEKREAALQTEIEEKRRKEVQEEQASARARRLRGGMRGLLSQTRLNPELGIKSAQTTLGA